MLTGSSFEPSTNEQGVAHAAIARRHHTDTPARYLAGALVLLGVALTRKHPTRGTTQPDAKSGTQATGRLDLRRLTGVWLQVILDGF